MADGDETRVHAVTSHPICLGILRSDPDTPIPDGALETPGQLGFLGLVKRANWAVYIGQRVEHPSMPSRAGSDMTTIAARLNYLCGGCRLRMRGSFSEPA